MFRWIFTLILNFLTFALVYSLHHRLSEVPLLKKHIPQELQTLPPIGKFFDPFKGFWANAEPPVASKKVQQLSLPGLHDEVSILFDDRLVPHIFAKNDHDLYYAQGYVTAMHRLWQMDFQTRAAAGRLSEIVGERALDFDRFQRRIGMVYAAEKALEAHMADSVCRMVMEAYTEGVNAYIAQIDEGSLPLEYKILDYKPEAWSPLKTALLLKYMAFDLSANGSSDYSLSYALAQYGKATIDSVFSNRPYREVPVIPEDTPLDFKPLPVPKQPKDIDSVLSGMAQLLVKTGTTQEKNYPKGSNNWAISGKKSVTGRPLLANDPHLQLRLPSIWYEVQLHAPGCNVYGVSLPGAPGVVIGFNERIAWGVTNSYADVLDLYRIEFKDKTYKEYRFNGQWKAVEMRKEVIQLRNGESVVEEVPYTVWGPVAVTKRPLPNLGLQLPPAHAIKWVAHEPSVELKTFYLLNRATNYDDFVKALEYFACPSQNFVYADSENNIALWVNGRHPLRWKEQGKFILPGTDSSYAWQGYLPHAHNPHVLNPKRGFVSSANQHSVSEKQYPYYLGWDYVSADRGLRINEVLSGLRRASFEDMRSLQNDELNVLAREVLPFLLARLRGSKLKGNYQKAFELLENWNFENNAQSIAATIFEEWWDNFTRSIWYDDFPAPMRYPELEMTLRLAVIDTTARWFDDRQTIEVEDYRAIAIRSFQQTIDQLQNKYGNIGEDWQWWKHKNTHIDHLAKIPGFGTGPLEIGGGSRMVNATGSTHGPSWRMVVQLGEVVQAWGIYPGGQSGNPGSPFYDNMIETWRVGSLATLLFLSRPEEIAENRLLYQLKLSKP
ncbi:penicillin amidase [Thermonema lapsum]|uniref:Penicillin amidase n=1 Tax=Thermonema lapsum TaxID=28195 RepID=A0A846MSX1_9BACT|nr:penicillin acylase family protein [Thermonema lapsum]NIK74555.1 penicillin amidase [Thermonema lapsum]